MFMLSIKSTLSLLLAALIGISSWFGMTGDKATGHEDYKTYKNVILLIGDGADISYKFLAEKGLDVRKFSEIFKFQHASGVAITAFRNYNRGEEAVSADNLIPSYLRLSQAERELKKSGDAKK